jgi:hypothetical protein
MASFSVFAPAAPVKATHAMVINTITRTNDRFIPLPLLMLVHNSSLPEAK